jgi:hypothetical protein
MMDRSADAAPLERAEHMTIEWVPRSARSEAGWQTAVGSSQVPAPLADEVDGTRAVRVPVVPQRGRPPRLRGWMVLILIWNFGNVMRGAHAAWTSLTPSFWLLLLATIALLVVFYRWMRLRPLTHRDEGDLRLSTSGIHTAGLVVPWTAVREVVPLRFAGGPGRGGPGPRHYLAVRVSDFVAVRGLTPAQAGLANLTRRRLVVLCESREVHDPTALAAAVRELVANPVARELLSGHEGVRLVSAGPPKGLAA